MLDDAADSTLNSKETRKIRKSKQHALKLLKSEQERQAESNRLKDSDNKENSSSSGNHEKVQPKPVQCPDCDRTFQKANHLKYHSVVHRRDRGDENSKPSAKKRRSRSKWKKSKKLRNQPKPASEAAAEAESAREPENSYGQVRTSGEIRVQVATRQEAPIAEVSNVNAEVSNVNAEVSNVNAALGDGTLNGLEHVSMPGIQEVVASKAELEHIFPSAFHEDEVSNHELKHDPLLSVQTVEDDSDELEYVSLISIQGVEAFGDEPESTSLSPVEKVKDYGDSEHAALPLIQKVETSTDESENVTLPKIQTVEAFDVALATLELPTTPEKFLMAKPTENVPSAHIMPTSAESLDMLSLDLKVEIPDSRETEELSRILELSTSVPLELQGQGQLIDAKVLADSLACNPAKCAAFAGSAIDAGLKKCPSCHKNGISPCCIGTLMSPNTLGLMYASPEKKSRSAGGSAELAGGREANPVAQPPEAAAAVARNLMVDGFQSVEAKADDRPPSDGYFSGDCSPAESREYLDQLGLMRIPKGHRVAEEKCKGRHPTSDQVDGEKYN